MILTLAVIVLAAALLSAGIAAVNLVALRAPRGALRGTQRVSVLIPARNEAAVIAKTVSAALASRGVAIEVLVGDDHSTDATAAIVNDIARSDPRLRLVPIPVLPEGWTGKNHACAVLAAEAGGDRLLFIDADVRLMPDAAASLAGEADRTDTTLLSAVPRQIMPSLGERLTVPMINWLLLGYLPMPLMRARAFDPGLGAACGQLILVERAAYANSGGHAAVRGCLHDGLRLPRLMRKTGHRTDLVAGSDLAECRMYRDFAQSWAGFSKNAHEGMATVRALPVWTVLLGAGHVLPWPMALAGWHWGADATAIAIAVAAGLISLATRTAVTLRSAEPLMTIPLHPVAVVVALAIQWNVLLRRQRAGAAVWKGRSYPVG